MVVLRYGDWIHFNTCIHGLVFEFCKQLLDNPSLIRVIGISRAVRSAKRQIAIHIWQAYKWSQEYDCHVITTTMSLLQDVLKANVEDIERKPHNYNGRHRTRRSSLEENPDSDDDLVNVVSPLSYQWMAFSTDARCRCPHPQLVPGHLLPLGEHPRDQSEDRSFFRQTAAGIPSRLCLPICLRKFF